MEKKTILIVDDDSRNIFALSAVLRSKGFQVVSSMSAIEGLRILEQNRNIGIVLMDIMMPDMDGYEAIAQIRSSATVSKIPVIAVTAQAMVGDREKSLKAGANAYISKPVDVDVLLRLLNKY
jgi:two-component system, cell cycle response regulator DivK